ncbi:MAG: helix-turn-helix domain-containing protein [Phormidium tanganyikae FI6-MK23]|jgi:ribosome-binding protein aMBF1 (putative translation factor)|nr:helix-turn-helix domain-containing protein [Phormidium tanganyikae FI6-MK23]
MLAQDSIMVSVTGTGEEFSDGFRALLSQIEAELYRSEVYRRALESLEQSAPEGTSAQFCLKSIGREAIRLALREMMPQTAPNPKLTEPIRPKKAVPEAEQHRREGLARLGAQIRTARQVRAMSIAELHSKTLVPVHQIQAIEAGHGAHLPEDVYLRGFIQRIAKVLNLDSVRLLDLLPAVDPVKAVLPTWYHPQKRSIELGGMALKPVHLYLGYAAVLSGGLVWLSHQSTPNTSINPNAPQVAPAAHSEAQPTVNMSANMQISAPERL